MIWLGEVEWYVFGSRALGTADEYSDLDLMFEGPTVEDLKDPYWQKQREFFETRHPVAEVWLYDKVGKSLVPLTSHSNALPSSEIVEFCLSHRVHLKNTQHLLCVLRAASAAGQKMFTSQSEYEMRAVFKYGQLEDLIKAWKKKTNNPA